MHYCVRVDPGKMGNWGFGIFLLVTWVGHHPRQIVVERKWKIILGFCPKYRNLSKYWKLDIWNFRRMSQKLHRSGSCSFLDSESTMHFGSLDVTVNWDLSRYETFYNSFTFHIFWWDLTHSFPYYGTLIRFSIIMEPQGNNLLSILIEFLS